MYQNHSSMRNDHNTPTYRVAPKRGVTGAMLLLRYGRDIPPSLIPKLLAVHLRLYIKTEVLARAGQTY
jgi:hypothetical protein